MTHEELLKDLKERSSVDSIVSGPTLQDSNDAGDRRYKVNIREISRSPYGATNVEYIDYVDVYYWVIDEGEETERAYYQKAEESVVE